MASGSSLARPESIPSTVRSLSDEAAAFAEVAGEPADIPANNPESALSPAPVSVSALRPRLDDGDASSGSDGQRLRMRASARSPASVSSGIGANIGFAGVLGVVWPCASSVCGNSMDDLGCCSCCGCCDCCGAVCDGPVGLDRRSDAPDRDGECSADCSVDCSAVSVWMVSPRPEAASCAGCDEAIPEVGRNCADWSEGAVCIAGIGGIGGTRGAGGTGGAAGVDGAGVDAESAYSEGTEAAGGAGVGMAGGTVEAGGTADCTDAAGGSAPPCAAFRSGA